jgi:anaerobic selenocysteine-containing dehydrogenase
MSIDRREFAKLSAIAAATAVAARNTKLAIAQDRVTEDGVSWDKAPCRFCGTGCHVQVGVKSGKVVAIAGDQKAEVNKGLLCVKGYHVGLALYGRDRLKTPMLRKNGKMTAVSWDEALRAIADRVELEPSDNRDNLVKGTVREVLYLGDHLRIVMSVAGNDEFIVKVPNGGRSVIPVEGQTYNLGWSAEDAKALDPVS